MLTQHQMGFSYSTYLTEQQRQPFLSSSHSSYSSPAWLTARDFSRALPARRGKMSDSHLEIYTNTFNIYKIYKDVKWGFHTNQTNKNTNVNRLNYKTVHCLTEHKWRQQCHTSNAVPNFKKSRWKTLAFCISV